MPIIKSAKKQMRQNAKRRARNFPVRSELKTTVKKFLKLVKDGSQEEAEKFIHKAYSVIDMGSKKNIIHPNNASRKKSRLAKALNGLKERVAGGETTEAPKKAAKAKKSVKAEK